jgi:hypothetical protein
MKVRVEKTVTVQVTDGAATGLNAAAVRRYNGVTFRLAAKKIGCSAAYLCDLENGRRPWGGKLGRKYLDWCESLPYSKGDE